jgi:hypothetical protein
MPRVRRRRLLFAGAIVALGCNQGLAPIPGDGACPPGFVGVCGTVRFRGAIPESTDAVFVLAYAAFPQSQADLFEFRPPIPFTPRLGLGDSITSYQLPLPRGRYEWILAAWKKVGDISLANADSLLREAGYYRDPSDPSQPGAVMVDGGLGGVDFVVDFDNMRHVSEYFPSGAPRP